MNELTTIPGASVRPPAAPVPGHPENAWIRLMFRAKAAKSGAVIRRASAWVEREIGRDRLLAEVRAREFHMIETGGQLVIICNRGGLRVLC